MHTLEPYVVQIGQDLLMTALALSAPAVLASLIVGVTISVLQTLTSIQEQTLTFAPRIIAVSLVILLTLSWSLQLLASFTERMVEYAWELAHS